MFVFYFRFTPGKAWLILISVLAFGLKIPFVVPVAFGLLGTPIWIIPASFGIIAFYLVELVKTSSTTLKNTDSDAMISGLTAFARQFAGNKEMWLMVAAVVLGTLFVHMIRTRSIDHAWKIASAAGAGICVIVASVGNLLLNGSISYIMIVLSALLGAAVGIVLEFLFFSVDYSRSENIQFEDDEYYYYVKAIPKIGVSVPEKSVKQITGRRKHPERGSETDLSGADDAGFRENPEDPERSQKSAEAKKQNTEEILLTRSLSRELGLDTEERDSE